MQVLLSSSHRYPALRTTSAKLNTTLFPSGSAYMTHDLLARGLAELGHEVFYFPRKGASSPLPPGVTLVHKPVETVDIHHMLIDSDEHNYWKTEAWSRPRVLSCHIDPRLIERDWGEVNEHWIFVSRSLAQSLGRERFVWNGINPDEYQYSSHKQDFHLFMAPMDWAFKKGLDIAADLAQTEGFRLIVAGGSNEPHIIQHIAEYCRRYPRIEFVGDVRGAEKAEILAGARSLIFPTKINEAFGLVIAEALMSGTPVICSKNGACPELVTEEVGFLCKSKNEYVSALRNLNTISSQACREKAFQQFHYGSMARAFAAEYRKEIEGVS